MSKKPDREDDLLEGKTIGELIGDGLQEFADALKRDKKSISREFTCHTMTLDVKPTRYTPGLVKKTREMLGASQAIYARFLGVSVKTVRAWEQGTNTPSESACRFMDEIRVSPAYFRDRIKSMIVKKSVVSTK